jgi:hypothetical protein
MPDGPVAEALAGQTVGLNRDEPVIADQDIIRLIEDLREPAARSFQYEYVAQRERPSDVPAVWDVAKPLKAAMSAHPEFAAPPDKFFLGRQISFFSYHQSVNLCGTA